MKILRAIFTKQAKDAFKNPSVLVMFIVFPAVAFIMTVFVPIPENDFMQSNMFVTMMASVFAGMGLINSAAAVIAEDIEKKSLRFLIIAGVKPHHYLIGTGGFYLAAGTITSIVFALIGGFTATEFVKFLTVMVTGTMASIILGASFGMMSKNQQAASGLVMPIAVIVGFAPMIAIFNETVEKIAGVLYTQQINVVVNDFSLSLTRPLLVISGNIAVFTALFIFTYKKNGLKG